MSYSQPKSRKIQTEYDIEQLRSSAKLPFQLSLSNRFSALTEISDPSEIFSAVTNATLDVAKKTLLEKPKCNDNWLSDRTKTAIINKHRMRKEKGHDSVE